jgi:hypothetical protein
MCIVIGDGDPLEVASNTGWSAFCAWVDTLDEVEFEPLVHLREYGWTEPLSELRTALAAALKAHSPADSNLKHVVLLVAEMIGNDTEEDDEVVVVSNGISPAGDDESDAESDADPKA